MTQLNCVLKNPMSLTKANTRNNRQNPKFLMPYWNKDGMRLIKRNKAAMQIPN